MAKKPEIKIEYKLVNTSFNKSVRETQTSVNTLNKEFKLKQEQMKNNSTESQRLEAELDKLNKEYDLAQQKTNLTASALQNTKEITGETSEETRKWNDKLIDAQRQQEALKNRIEETTGKLEAAKQAEKGLTEEQQKAIEASEKRKARLGELESQQDSLQSSSEKLTKEYELQVAQLGENASESDKLKLKQEYLANQMGNSADQVKNLEEQLVLARQEFGENSKEVDKLEKELLETKKANQEFTNQFEESTNTLKNFGEKAEQVGQDLKDMGKTWTTNVTVPLLGIGTAATVVGTEFEKAMSKVQALTGATANEIEELEKKARDLGATTMFSATQAAEGMAFLGMAGYETNEILDSMDGLLALAAAGSLDLASAADITTNIMSAFGLSAEETGQTADALAYAFSNANTDMGQLGEAMKYLAPVANSLGWSLEESAAMVMAVSDAGIQGGTATNSFATSLTRLTKPTKEMQTKMNELGLEFFDAEGKMKPIPEIIAMMETGMADMTEEQQANTLATLFGSNAYKQWAVLLEEGSESLAKNTAHMEDAEGKAQELADVMQDNLAGQALEMKSVFEEVGITIYQIIQPALEKLIALIKSLGDWFNNLSPKAQKLIVVIGAIAAAIGPIMVVIGSFVVIVGKLGIALGLVFGVAAAKMTAIVAIIPIIVLAVASLVAAIIIYWDEIKEATINIWNAIKDFLIGIWEVIKETCINIWNSIKEFFTELWESIKEICTDVWNSIKEFFTELWNGIKETCTDIWNGIKDYLLDIWNAISESVTEVFNNIKDFMAEIWESVKETCINMWNDIVETLTPIIEFLFNVIMVPISLLQAVLEGIWLLIKAGAIIAWEAIKIAAEWIWEGIKENIIAPVLTATEWVNTQFQKLQAWLLQTWQNTKDSATALWEGIKENIINAISAATEWVNTQFQKLQAWLLQIWQNIKDSAAALWGGIKENIIDPITEAREKVVDTITTLWTNMIDVFDNIKNTAKQKFDETKENMLAPIRAAKDTLSGYIDEIKGFFSNLILKIPIPTLPELPRFTLKTNSRTVLGQEITYPSGFDVHWNAKGGIFGSPTIIGAYGGALQGVGEVPGESEAVLPLNEKTLGMIGDGIANTMNFDDMLGQYIQPQANANMQFATAVKELGDKFRAGISNTQLPPIVVTAKTYLDNEVIGQAQFPIINGLLAEESQRISFFGGGNS